MTLEGKIYLIREHVQSLINKQAQLVAELGIVRQALDKLCDENPLPDVEFDENGDPFLAAPQTKAFEF